MDSPSHIPFNRPFLTGKEKEYIDKVLSGRRFSGNGPATKWCEDFFESRYGFVRALMTPSCTDALEMSALLLDLQPGDEVILPSFTFPSTANAFALRGAVLRFADSCPDHPNMSVESVRELINERTRAIVCVHYAGVACEPETLAKIATENNIVLIEDAAHAIESSYNGKQLGSFGALSTFSFHETKNVHCGEGGMLVVNDPSFLKRAEIIREKGTNRDAFFRGEVDKYGWVDIGSSFLPNEISCAFLAGQLDNLEMIQSQRIARWNRYAMNLSGLTNEVTLPVLPAGTSNNAHLFYLVCDAVGTRSALIRHLSAENIQAVFHYQSLHASPYFRERNSSPALPNSDKFSDCLVRLPLYNELSDADIDRVSDAVIRFFRQRKK